MGFLKPSPPPFDLAEWRAKPYLSRLKANVQEWAVNGFGTASVAYLLYTVKLVVYAVGALAVISATTRGLGALSDIGAWWTEPVVFQKLAVWTLLWGILGLGEGSMPLTLRFLPPIGASSTGCVPARCAYPRGPARSRSRAARGGRWSTSSSTPPSSENQIAGWQLAFVCVWWGAAASKLNRHFPYTTTVMISNTPWYPRFVKTRLWKRYPEDVRPSLLAGIAAHIGTALEFGPPSCCCPPAEAGSARSH